MRGILQVLAAWCLVRAWAEPRHSVMDGVYWCNTLCMCRVGTQLEVQCFQWTQLYELMASADTSIGELKSDEWLLEGQAYWCDELCLCNINDDRESKCVQKNALVQLVTDHIADWYLYEGEEETEEDEQVMGERLLQEEEEREEAKYRKRNEKRKNRKNRKPKKNARVKDEILIPVVDDVSFTTEQALTPGPTISSLPHHFSPDQNEPVSEESPEPLLRQEAVSASPTVTTIHLQLSRQALPTTAASAYTTHESTAEEEPHSTAAKVTPVREVPMERKTVASEVSQDLDELGRAVMQIKSDVILNQRILLVTVAVAGTAMLGVLIMAVHECSSRRQALTNKKKDVAKDDDHVTKVNLEEAW